MKQYKVKAEFVDEWYGGNDYTDEPISEDEIKSLAADWEKSIEELMDQVEEQEDVNMKEFEYNEITVVFWKEGETLFCKVDEMGADVYCCGSKAMPETVEEAVKLTETAWMW